MDLQNMKCVACRGGEPTLTDDEIEELLIGKWLMLMVSNAWSVLLD